MKIPNNTPNYINQTYTNQTNAAANKDLKSQKSAAEAVNEPKTDSINFSERTKELQKISRAMETEPTDRSQYVADIKQMVETNQYNINAETVAEKMIGFFVDGVHG